MHDLQNQFNLLDKVKYLYIFLQQMYAVKSEMKKLLHMAHTFNQTDTFIIDYLYI